VGRIKIKAVDPIRCDLRTKFDGVRVGAEPNGEKMNKIKLSDIVKLHEKAKPAIEKAILEVLWDEDDEALMKATAEQINAWGGDPTTLVEPDVPLGLGDTDVLIRFLFSLFQIFEDEGDFKLANFYLICKSINRPVTREVSSELFGE
jgi:hypothetical protein